MPLFNSKYAPYLLLVLLSIPLFFLNIYSVHTWGDDFAQYIKEAQNIAWGKPYYQSNYIYNQYNPTYAPPQYPPGFPFLLAPVVRFWGLSITAMCYFNSLMASLVLIALYRFFRNYAGFMVSVCLALAISYSGYLIELKRNILADVPCLFFVTLYLSLRKSDRFSWQKILLLILLVVCAIQIRSQAIFVLFAEVVFFCISAATSIIKKQSLSLKFFISVPSLLIAVGALLLNVLLDKVFFPPPVSTTGFYNSFYSLLTGGGIVDMAEPYVTYVVNTATCFFHFETFNGYKKAAMLVLENAGLSFAVVGFIIKVRKSFGVEDVFFLVMCLVILFFPGRDARYFLPAVPVLFSYSYFGFRVVVPFITAIDPRRIALCLTIIYFWVGSGYLKAVTKEHKDFCVPLDKEYQAFNYLKTHVRDNEIIIFTKPRFLTLYTDRKAVNVSWQMNPEMNKKYFDSLNVKYLLIVDGLDDSYFHDYLRNTQHPIDSARIAAGYTLYSLR